MVEDIIKSYNFRLSEIKEFINDLDEKHLFFQSNKYPPSTICHPIWTLGHLCISAQGIGEEMSMKHWLDDNWIKIYGQQSNPTDNPLDYHSKSELIVTLNDAQKRIEKRLLSMTKKELEGPMPDVRFHDIFPTLMHAITGILIEHVSEHIKMLIIWKYYLLNG